MSESVVIFTEITVDPLMWGCWLCFSHTAHCVCVCVLCNLAPGVNRGIRAVWNHQKWIQSNKSEQLQSDRGHKQKYIVFHCFWITLSQIYTENVYSKNLRFLHQKHNLFTINRLRRNKKKSIFKKYSVSTKWCWRAWTPHGQTVMMLFHAPPKTPNHCHHDDKQPQSYVDSFVHAQNRDGFI